MYVCMRVINADIELNAYRYNEATVLLKGSPDVVWYASVLEGLATVRVLEAWGSPNIAVC